jgi:hypothetical protein
MFSGAQVLRDELACFHGILVDKCVTSPLLNLLPALKLNTGRNCLHRILLEREPQAVEARRPGKGKGKRIRGRYSAPGVNDHWCLNQNDKLKSFGIWQHLGVEPISGRILWLKAWFTNRNQAFICSLFINTVRNLQCKYSQAIRILETQLILVVPMMTMSDRGLENVRVAEAQTAFRHIMDPELAELQSIQHYWMNHLSDIKPEAEFSLLGRNTIKSLKELLDPSDRVRRFRDTVNFNDPIDV